MYSNNINITNGDKKFTYYFEYVDKQISYDDIHFKYQSQDNKCMFVNELSSNLNNFKNYWTDVDKTTLTNLYCPDFINISNINVYFPTHSVETYETKMKYVLVAKIYIDNVEVVLGNFLIDRFDAVACEKPRKFLNQTYYEQCTITIPDPHYIVYHDDWKRWRMYNIYKSSELNFLSGDELEQFIENYQESNDTTSNIVLQFYPVEYVDNKYIKSIVYQGGQNSIQFNDGEQFLSLNLNHNFNVRNNQPSLISTLKYNPYYSNLSEYLKETYNITQYYTTLEIVIKDTDNIYKYINIPNCDETTTIPVSEFGFTNWAEYLSGLKFYAIFTIYDSEDSMVKQDQFNLQIPSNELNITKEVFKYLIDLPIHNINLDIIDMINYNCNIVNKIQKNIVKIDRPSDYKSNIIKPVFFRTQELSKLQIHSSVTENIALNLDEYKNKVDIFYLNINGTLFQEIGRTNQGIIFKIIGQKIDKSIKSGNYYILNQDQEMVTYGEYTII